MEPTAATEHNTSVCSLLVDQQHLTTSRTSPRFQYKNRTEEARPSVDMISTDYSVNYMEPDELYSATSSSSTSCQQSYLRRNSVPVNLAYFPDSQELSELVATPSAELPVTEPARRVASVRTKSKKKLVVRQSAPKPELNSSHTSIDFKSIVNNYHCMVFTCLKKACGMEAGSREEMISHLKNTHREDDESITHQDKFDKMVRLSYKCLVPVKPGGQSTTCGKKLESLNKIANHARKDHANYLGKNLSYFYMCSHPDCFWLFENDNDLKAHKLEHKLEVDANYTVEKKHVCQFCSLKFARPSHLAAHVKLHDQQNVRIKCDICEETMTTQSQLLSHMNQCHKNAEKTYKCHYEGCGRAYTLKMYLAGHITKMHKQKSKTPPAVVSATIPAIKDNEVFKCEVESCQKLFGSRNNLRRHQKIHNKENKLKCNEDNCSAEFIRRDYLVAHQRVHNVKTIKCDYPNCKSEFRHVGNLTTHRRLTHNQPGGQVKKSVLKIDFQNCTTKYIAVEKQPMVVRSTSLSQPPSNKKIIRLSATSNGGLFSCNDCHLRFDSHEQLTLHSKTHLDINLVNQKLNVYLVANKEMTPSSSESSNQNGIYQESPASSLFINEPPVLDTSLLANENSLEVNDDSQEDLSTRSVHRHHEHVIININSDDEEFSTCSVVLDNMSGSARTDYKFNHQYIEKYTLKRKLLAQQSSSAKRFKEGDVCNESEDPVSTMATSPKSISSTSSRSSPMPLLPPNTIPV